MASVSEYYFSKKLKEIGTNECQRRKWMSSATGVRKPDTAIAEEDNPDALRAAHLPQSDGRGYMPYVGIPRTAPRFLQDFGAKMVQCSIDEPTEIQPLIGSKASCTWRWPACQQPGEQVVGSQSRLSACFIKRILGAGIVNHNWRRKPAGCPTSSRPRNGWSPGIVKLVMDQLSPLCPQGKEPVATSHRKPGGLRTPGTCRHRKTTTYSFILNEHPISILISGCQRYCMNSIPCKSHNMPGWRIGMLASIPTSCNGYW